MGSRFSLFAKKSFPWWGILISHLIPLQCQSCPCDRPAPAVIDTGREQNQGDSLFPCSPSLFSIVLFLFWVKKEKSHNQWYINMRLTLLPTLWNSNEIVKSQPSRVFDWWPLKVGQKSQCRLISQIVFSAAFSYLPFGIFGSFSHRACNQVDLSHTVL